MKPMIVENSRSEMQNRTGHKHSIQFGFSLLKNVVAIFCLVAISIGVFGTSEVLAVQDNRLKEDQMIRILLPESSVVEKETYRLGDIARLEGPDPYLIERLEGIKIGRSPLPGRDLSVSRSIMLSRIRSAKIDTAKIVFPASQNTRVQRAALKIPGKDIDQSVLNHIQEAYSGMDIKPRILAKTRDVFLPRGEVSYRILKKGRHLKEGGYQTYELEFSVDGKPMRKVPVRTYIKLYKDVVIAKDTIKADHVIGEADILKVRRNVDRMPSKYVTDSQDILGKVASRAINPNEVIRETTVAAQPVVKSGDRLMIIFETPNLRLTAPGMSLQKGALGDRIQVRNLQSKILVYATVRDKNHVQVN